MFLQGKKVLITGGTSGIGFELVKRLIEAGNQVYVCGRNKEKLDQVRKRLPEVHTFQCAITEWSVDEVLSWMKQEGEIDVLVNNAGVQMRYNWTEGFYDNAVLEAQVNYLACVKFIDGFLKQDHIKGKMIVNITSLLGIIPKRSAPTYCSSKSAIHTFTQSLRYQLKDTGVTVCEVVPPLVATPMASVQSEEKQLPVDQCVDEIIRGIEHGRQTILPGKAKKLQRIYRLLPKVIDTVMQKK